MTARPATGAGGPVKARLLVTGFGPFPGVPVNPCERLIAALAEARPGLATARFETLWTAPAEVTRLAARADLVLMFGVAASERRIRYERVALPAVAAAPDARGALPAERRLAYRMSGLPVPALADAARRAGFPVRLSHSAGRYICNAAYGAALGANRRTLFVHIPLPTRHGPLGADGLLSHALWLVDRLAEEGPAAGRPRPVDQAGLRGW